MSETCIVCLGDLGENVSVQPLPEALLLHDAAADQEGGSERDAGASTSRSPEATSKSPVPEAELIAHLLPCGHNLHDECLKPWVERANSCPICRQKFNQVDLVKRINGPVVSSYPVQDRVQVAEIDPSMLIEEEDEPEFQPCRICGNDENEDVLLICDGCSVPHHTYCVELGHEVPSGPWFCEECALNRAIEASMADGFGEMPASRPLAAPSASRRTRAQLRRNRNSALARASDWARIWESVYDRANLDLDFPYQDEDREILRRTPHTQHARDSIWRRRLQVAQQQGGGEQLRHIVPLLDNPTVSRPRPEREEPESIEEVIAWNALEKARDIHQAPSPRASKQRGTNSPVAVDSASRKRQRSRSTSLPRSPILPAPDLIPQQHQQRKKPRTRRVNDSVEPSMDVGEASASRLAASVNMPVTNGAGPSFLQSLLKEVENSTPVDEPPRGRPSLSVQATLDHAYHHASSPEASPTSSNLPSPRGSASPPPTSRRRPGSPSLTSRIEPIYPKLGPIEALPSGQDSIATRPKLKPKSRKDSDQRVKQWVDRTAASSPERASDLSPTRASMSLSAKERIQKLVREALKEPYTANMINSDQYTDINRRISRQLYDTIGEGGTTAGDEAIEWRRLAGEEVDKAIKALQPAIGS